MFHVLPVHSNKLSPDRDQVRNAQIVSRPTSLLRGVTGSVSEVWGQGYRRYQQENGGIGKGINLGNLHLNFEISGFKIDSCLIGAHGSF